MRCSRTGGIGGIFHWPGRGRPINFCCRPYQAASLGRLTTWQHNATSSRHHRIRPAGTPLRPSNTSPNDCLSRLRVSGLSSGHDMASSIFSHIANTTCDHILRPRQSSHESPGHTKKRSRTRRLLDTSAHTRDTVWRQWSRTRTLLIYLEPIIFRWSRIRPHPEPSRAEKAPRPHA